MNDRTSDPTASAPTLTERALDHFWGWAALLVISGWLVGVSVYPVVEPDVADYIIKNRLDPEARGDLVRYGIRGVMAVAALYVAVWLAWWRKDHALRPTDAFRRFSKAWYLSLSAPLLAALFVGGLERDSKLLALLFITLIAIGVMVFVYLRPRAQDLEPAPAPSLPVWYRDRALGVVVVLCILYGTAMTYLSLVEHRALGTHTFDLGIYDNLMWNTARGDWLSCTLCRGGNHASGHFDPILIAMSPIYRIWPRAETLLVFQSWWLATSGVPLYLIGRRALPEARGFVVVVVALFFFHPALHGINLFDFHSMALAVPLLLWAVHCIDSGARWWFPLMLVLLLAVREDMPLIAGFIGLYAILRRRVVWGVLTIVVAMTYLYVIKNYAMPDSDLLMKASKEATSHIYYYEDMIPHQDEGMKGLVVSTFTNPAFVLKVIFLNNAKNFYLFGMLIPMMFLPLFGGSKRVLMLYALAFIGLVSRKHVYSYHFQYSAVLLPFFVASIPGATKQVTEWLAAKGVVPTAAHLRRTLMWGMLTATLLLSSRFGAFVPNGVFKGGWNRLNRRLTPEKADRYEAVREMVAMIPEDGSVSATNGLVPHVSNREFVHKYPRVSGAEYLLLNVKGLLKKRKYRAKIKSIRRKFETLMEYEGIELFRRLPPKAAETPKKKKKRKKKAKPRAPAVDTDVDSDSDSEAGDDEGTERRGQPPKDETDDDHINPNVE